MSLAEFAARVEQEARQAHPGRAILTAVAAVLYAVGWLAAWVVTGVLLVVVWAFTAAKIGYRDVRQGRKDGGT